MDHFKGRDKMTKDSLAQIKTYLLPADSDVLNKLPLDVNILGIIQFGGSAGYSGQQFTYIPYLYIEMQSFSDETYYEVWTSSHAVSYGTMKNLHYATDGYHYFAAISVKEATKSLDQIGAEIYGQIFESIEKYGYPHIFRIWNYIPFINGASGESNRYKLYCFGRAKVFEEKSMEVGYPSATGIGSFGDSVNICFIATRDSIHINIENPRQTPAYKYPWVAGLKPPSFSRGTYSDYTYANSFYVSGTASILGHETVFVGDVKRQCETTIKNVECLISPENMGTYGISQAFHLKDLDCIKVYIKNQAEYAVIKDICDNAFSSNKSILYLQAEICRENLLVEIEGLIQNNL